MRTLEARGGARLLALVVACSCASNPTPSDRRLSQEEAISSGKGAYALVRTHDGASQAGELIAASSDHMLLLTDLGHLVEIDGTRVAKLTLGVHDNNEDAFVLWGVLGSLSTISHGFFLIYSFPIWLVSSIGATAQESHRGLFRCPADTPDPTHTPMSMPACLWNASAYARFPQGLPPGVGREQLLGRAPVVVPTPPAVTPIPAPSDAGAPEGPLPYDQPD
jgi:hypothetical protein